MTRPPLDSIPAPVFPPRLPLLNASGPPAALLRAPAMLVEFWDFCRPNSLRTLPYLKAWHARYSQEGLRLVGVHCPGFEPSRSEASVREAVERLGIRYPVLIDSEFEIWRDYGNEGWPARYLFDGRALLYHYHFGEGAYAETEHAIQELLQVSREPLAPIRPEDVPGVGLAAQTEDKPGVYCGPYEAGGVWAVLEGLGTVRASGVTSAGAVEVTVTHPGAYELIEHERHTAGVLELHVGAGVRCHATCFTPGVL